MNLTDAEALLANLARSVEGPKVEVGVGGQGAYRYAFIKLTSSADASQYAIVSTPGINWYELGVTGDFSTGQTDDQAEEEDVREYLEKYLHAATAYLDGRWSMGKSRVLRVPILTIQTDNGPLNLAPRGHWSTNRN